MKTESLAQEPQIYEEADSIFFGFCKAFWTASFLYEKHFIKFAWLIACYIVLLRNPLHINQALKVQIILYLQVQILG